MTEDWTVATNRRIAALEAQMNELKRLYVLPDFIKPKAEAAPRKTLGDIARAISPFRGVTTCQDTWDMVAEAVAEAIIERHLAGFGSSSVIAAIAAIRAEFK